MLTFFILISLIVVKCIVDFSYGTIVCNQIDHRTLALALATGGAELIFEIRGLLTIIKKNGTHDSEDDKKGD